MTIRSLLSRVAFVSLMLLALPALAQQPITYQGQLRQAGTPFTGMADLEFRLYDSLSGGSQVGPALTRANWPIEDGLFQVELDFGAGSFGPDPRWLEIVVDGILLDPRQRVQAAPMAMFALAGNEGPPGPAGPTGPPGPEGPPGDSQWAVNGTSTYYDQGHVGIGTDLPLATLHVERNSTISQPQLALVENEDDYARMTFANTATTSRFWSLAALTRGSDPADDRFNIFSSVAGDVLSATGQGRVGISTLTPTATLDVAGNTRVRSLSHADATVRKVRADSQGNLTTALREQFLTIPSSAFAPALGSSIPFVAAPTAFFIDNQTGFNAIAVAPVAALPHGATLTGLDLWYFDNSGTSDLSVALQECTHASANWPTSDSCRELAEVESTGQSSVLTRTVQALPLVPDVRIDHEANAYHLVVATDSWTSALLLRSVRLSFSD